MSHHSQPKRSSTPLEVFSPGTCSQSKNLKLLNWQISYFFKHFLISHLFFLFSFFCVYTYVLKFKCGYTNMYVQVLMHVCVWVCIEARRWCKISSSISLYLTYWGKVFHWSKEQLSLPWSVSGCGQVTTSTPLCINAGNLGFTCCWAISPAFIFIYISVFKWQLCSNQQRTFWSWCYILYLHSKIG